MSRRSLRLCVILVLFASAETAGLNRTVQPTPIISTSYSDTPLNVNTFSSPFNSTDETEDTPTTISTKIDQIEATKTTISTKIDEIEATKTTISTEIDEIEGTKTPISTEIDEIEGTKTTISTEIDEIEGTKPTTTIWSEIVDSSLPVHLSSDFHFEFPSPSSEFSYMTPTPTSDFYEPTNFSNSILLTNQIDYSSLIDTIQVQPSPTTSLPASTTEGPSPALYHVTGTLLISMEASINITETKELMQSNEPSEAQLDFLVKGIISNNTCACTGQEPVKDHCPCEALLGVLSNHDMSPLKFFCQTLQDDVGSSFRTSCNVTYQETEETQRRVPFACVCQVEFRPSFNPSKLDCTCNDTVVPTPDPPNNCNCSADPNDCNCTLCQCHEIQVYPNVFVRHNCNCEESSNRTIINDVPYVNEHGCQQYDFAGKMVQVFVNCSKQVVEETTTTVRPTPKVNTSCPCKEMSFAGGEVIVLYNCTCENGPDGVVAVTETSRSEAESCNCVEFSFFDGKVKFRVNCTCETKVDTCTCQGIYVDGRHIVVCLNCSRNEPLMTTTTTTTTTARPIVKEKCEPKCKKAELFDGQIAIHFNCSCRESTKVFYHESLSAIEDAGSLQCPCQNGMSENTRNLLKRHVVSDERNGSVLFCSCEMRDRRESLTSTAGNEFTTSERVELISESTSKPANETSTESLTGGIPEKYWIRTVLNIKLENINDSKWQIESKLASAYRLAFRRQRSINLGLRTKRQVKSNVTVTILHIRPYESRTSQTEIIYAVKSDGDLIPAKNAVRHLKLLDANKEIEKIMAAGVVFTEEYRKTEESTAVSSSSNAALIAGSIVTAILIANCLLFICCYYKKRQKKLLNEQQVFQESGFVRQDSDLKNRTSAPLIDPPIRRRSDDSRPIRKKKSNKGDLEAGIPQVFVSTPSDSGRSDESLIRIKKTQKKKKLKRESPLPLDVHRMLDHYQLPEDVFDHVTTPPTKLVRKKKKLAPINFAHTSFSGNLSNLDRATISGSMNPIPPPRKTKPSTKERNRLNYSDDDHNEIDSMIRSRADRVCSAEFFIEDIRSELERFHKSIPTPR